MSSAIGGFTPQRYIWRLCIALHSGPRFVALVVNYNIFRNRTVHRNFSLYNLLVKLASLLNLVENGCLLLLTCVSSSENYGWSFCCLNQTINVMIFALEKTISSIIINLSSLWKLIFSRLRTLWKTSYSVLSNIIIIINCTNAYGIVNVSVLLYQNRIILINHCGPIT